MSNIVPASEGWLTEEQFDALRKEIRDVVAPLLDGTDLTEGITLSGELFQAIMEIKNLPEEGRVLSILSALGSIVDEIQQDLVVRYTEEG